MKHNLFVAAVLAAVSLPAAAGEHAACSCCKPAEAASATKTSASPALPAGTKSAFYAVKMHCGGCVQGISSTLKKLPGVKGVSADLKGQRIKVTYVSSKVSSSKIVSTLDSSGFKAKPL